MNQPRCPKCGSTNLWDDNLWEGCNDCDYTNNGQFLVVRKRDNAVVGRSLNNCLPNGDAARSRRNRGTER